MTQFTKNVYKGINFNTKIKKSRYWDKNFTTNINENTTLDVELTPFEGISATYDINDGSSARVTVSSGLRPDYIKYNGTVGYLTTKPSSGYYLFPENSYSFLTKVGSPTLDNETGIASNFSSSNYFTTNFLFRPQSKPWAWQVKFKQTEEFTGSVQYIMCSSRYTNAPYITILADNKINVSLASNGSYVAGVSSDFTVEVNKDYWVRLEFDGSGVYTVKYSLDGTTYETIGTVENTTTITATDVLWFGKTGHDTYLHGEIDFSETFVEIDGKKFWKPNGKLYTVMDNFLSENNIEPSGTINYNIFANDEKTLLSTKETLDGYIWIGNLDVTRENSSAFYKLNVDTVGDCKIIDGYGHFFSASNYFITQFIHPSSEFFAQNVEIITRVTTATDSTGNIIYDNSSHNYGFGITSNNKWKLYNGSENTGGTYEYNTTYWVKFVEYGNPEDGSDPYTALYYMLDDGKYTSAILGVDSASDDEWTLAVKLDTGTFFGNNNLVIGNSSVSTSQYWRGSIDIRNTVINGQTWKAWEHLVTL